MPWHGVLHTLLAHIVASALAETCLDELVSSRDMGLKTGTKTGRAECLSLSLPVCPLVLVSSVRAPCATDRWGLLRESVPTTRSRLLARRALQPSRSGPDRSAGPRHLRRAGLDPEGGDGPDFYEVQGSILKEVEVSPPEPSRMATVADLPAGGGAQGDFEFLEVEADPRGLLECIELGVVDDPPLCTWNRWQAWRATLGRRPVLSLARGSAERRAFVQQESRLWREVMASRHGADWRDQLAGEDDGESVTAEALPVPPAAFAEELDGGDGDDGDGRAEPLPLVVARADEESSGVLSAASWAALSVDELRSRALNDFDPALETLPEYEGRVYRAVALLEARQLPIPESELQGRILRARFIMETAGQQPPEALRTLRGALARILEEDDGTPLHAARAEAVVSLLSERAGGAPGGVLGRLLLSGSSGAGSTREPPAPPGLETPVLATPERPGLRTSRAGTTPPSGGSPGSPPGLPSGARAGQSVTAAPPAAPLPSGRQDLVSEAILELLQERRSRVPKESAEPRSTIQVRPTLTWPQLGDEDYDVVGFLEEFEDTVGLANDCQGMNFKEKIRVLGQCLKQSRQKAFKVVTKAARQSGELNRDPEAVYNCICQRLMEFREGLIEQQTRVDRDFENCTKGRLSAMQFLPVWENVIAELELKGIGKSERELLLGYLKRVGQNVRTEVLKDRRAYPLLGGGEEVRQVRNWREAHALVVEQEQLLEGSRALIGGVGLPSGAPGGGNPRRGGRRGRSRSAQGNRDGNRDGSTVHAVEPVLSIMPDHLRQVCWQLRDKGKCDRENCHFDHDPRRVAEAKQYSAGGKGKGKGKGSGGKGGKGSSDARSGSQSRKKEVCRAHLAGRCNRGDQCPFSHSTKVIASLSKAIMAFEQSRKGAAQASTVHAQQGSQPSSTVPNVSTMAVSSVPSSSTPAAPAAAAAQPSPQPGSRAPASAGAAPAGADGGLVLQWVRRDVASAHVYGPLWDGAPPPAPGYAQLEYGVTSDLSAPVRRLGDLPPEAWTRVAKPSAGYNYRTLATVLGRRYEVLIDTGAATNVVSEELVVRLVNAAVSQGLTPEHEDWPVFALEEWGSEEEATGVSRDAPLRIIGSVVLRLTLEGVDGRKVDQLFRFKVFALGCSSWHGFILGGPALEPPPVGLGYRPSLAGHVFEGLGIVMPRVEEHLVEGRMNSIFFCEVPRELDTVHNSTVHNSLRSASESEWPDGGAILCELDESDSDLDDPVGGSVPVLCGRENLAPVLLDADALELSEGEAAWVPACVAGVMPSTVHGTVPGTVPSLEILPNSCSRVRAANGAWDGLQGMLLVFCLGQPSVVVRRGDIVAAAWSGGGVDVAAGAFGSATVSRSPPAPAVHTLESRAFKHADTKCGDFVDSKCSDSKCGDMNGDMSMSVNHRAATAAEDEGQYAHIIVDDATLERMFEVEMPPEEYYTLLRQDMGRRHSKACPHLLDHLISTEVLLNLAAVSGFSFGVAKCQVCQTSVRLLGEIVGREHRDSTDEHVAAILNLKPVEDLTQLRSLLGLCNWVRDHCAPEFHVAAKTLSRWLRKGAEWPLDAEGKRAELLLKQLAARHVRLSAIDEVAVLSGDRELHQVADCSKVGWGGTVYQLAPDRKTLNVLGFFSGMLTDAQVMWPILAKELFAQLQVTRRRRRVLGRLPAVCWTDHANVVRVEHQPEAEEKHIRWISEIESDGSRLQNLSGRSAVLGDALSRLLQESLDQHGKRFREFSIEDYLDECEEDGLPPSALVGHAPPTPERGPVLSMSVLSMPLPGVPAVAPISVQGDGIGRAVLLAAVAAEAPRRVRCAVLPLYGTEGRRLAAQGLLWRQLQNAYPGLEFVMVPIDPPFQDALGNGMFFEPQVLGGNPDRIPRRLRRDFLTSVVTAIRGVCEHQSEVVFGLGQGAVVAAALALPRVLETALASKTVTHTEVADLARAWSRLRAVHMLAPCLTKALSEVRRLEAAVPELFKASDAKERLPLFGLRSEHVAKAEEMTRRVPYQLIRR